MTLEYKVKDKGEEKKEVRVQFDPPLAGYEEVKPRLLAMTADAQESLGMVCLLRIDHSHLISSQLLLSLRQNPRK